MRWLFFWGTAVFVLVNALSWDPGYGHRTDLKPGQEIERYFGWPAHYYCGLWRSDRPELDLLRHFTLIPLASEMTFAYSSHSILALLLDAGLIACGMVIWRLGESVSSGKKLSKWTLAIGIALTITAVAIILFGDEVSAYL